MKGTDIIITIREPGKDDLVVDANGFCAMLVIITGRKPTHEAVADVVSGLEVAIEIMRDEANDERCADVAPHHTIYTRKAVP